MASTTTDATQAVQAAQDEFVSAVRQNQQAILDSVSAWTKAVNEFVPSNPTAGPVPEPEIVIDSAYDFAHKLLDAQRDFARGLVAATAPAREQAAAKSSKS